MDEIKNTNETKNELGATVKKVVKSLVPASKEDVKFAVEGGVVTLAAIGLYKLIKSLVKKGQQEPVSKKK